MEFPELSEDTKRVLIYAVDNFLTKRDIDKLEPMIGRERTDKVHKEVLTVLEWLHSTNTA